jgi:hypothetical protein
MPLDDSRGEETIYTTNEGPVVITVRGKFVFVSESFDLATARKLAGLLIDGQGTGEIRTAAVTTPRAGLSQSLVDFMHSCGMMKSAILH